MRAAVTLAVKPALEETWLGALSVAAERAGVAIDLRRHGERAPGETEVLVYGAAATLQDLAPYAGVAFIQCLWAGVEKVLANPTLPEVPLCRMVEPGLTEGMTDYVVAHVMRLHMDLDRRLAGPEEAWMDWFAPLSRHRRVGVLGLGELGRDAATALAALRFDVAGWSRTPKELPGVTCLHGAEGLRTLLARSEILVGLLPSTPATDGLLDAAALATLPRGARIVNAGRGELIDDAALLAALDAGHVAQATLDVFREEPLPADHPYRRHPRVTVTPHVASATRPETAAGAVIAQIARWRDGRPLAHVVDRARGY